MDYYCGAYQRLERRSRYESWESETAWKMDDSPSVHRWLSPLVCDTASLIDRRLRARDCYLLSCTDVHAQHNLGEWALVDHFAHQVAAHTLSVGKVLEQVMGHFSKAGSCCLLQLPWICHAPIQRWLQHSWHDASDARPLADPQDDAEDGGRQVAREEGHVWGRPVSLVLLLLLVFVCPVKKENIQSSLLSYVFL